VKSLPQFQTLGFLVIATTLEVTGDAIVRIGLFHHAGMARAGIMLAGALLLLGYGWSLNLAPLEFRRHAVRRVADRQRRDLSDLPNCPDCCWRALDPRGGTHRDVLEPGQAILMPLR
jgi:hypothetical protein